MPNFQLRTTNIARHRGVAGVCALVLAALLAGCGSSTASPREQAGDRLLVLTTFTVIADIAQEVGGEHVHVESVTKVGAEIHGYEPTPDDLRRASEADLILENGLGLEAWFARFTARLDVPHVTLSDGVEPMPVGEFGPADGADAHTDVPNPHAWMSPLVGAQYAHAAAEAFAVADPDHADAYRANAERYAAELVALNDTLAAALATIPEQSRVLATCEGAFSYLARDAGLREVYLWPVNAEQQATPRRMEAAVDAVREGQVPAVFCESTVSADAQHQVAREAGSTFGGVLYVDSLSEPDGPVPTYQDLLRYDVELIIAGLTGAAAPSTDTTTDTTPTTTEEP